MDTLAARRPSESRVEATHLVLPPDTNFHGTAFGGRIIEWMDIAAGVAAGRHCRGPTVTAAVDELHFAHPIQLGDVVVILACVNFAGRTSMEVGVRVETEDNRTGKRLHCLTAYFTFVSVNPNGRPNPVPPIAPETSDEIRRYQKAKLRREQRLKQRTAQHARSDAK